MSGIRLARGTCELRRLERRGIGNGDEVGYAPFRPARLAVVEAADGTVPTAMPMMIDISRTDDLIDVEAKLTSTIDTAPGSPITVRLARHLRPDFFLESRIAALFATLDRRHRLTICDWHNQWREEEVDEHFRTSLVGLSAALFSDALVNLENEPFPETEQTLCRRIAEAGGILEPREARAHAVARGSSITFCAFDPDWSEPAALAGTVNQQAAFKDLLRRYRRKYLEVGHGIRYTPATRTTSDALDGFIFELYQNTYRHGRTGVDNLPIPGLRYVRLRKHVGRREGFLSRARRFDELSAYLSAVTHRQADCKFYEVAVCDHGMGMVNRFLHARPDLPRSTDTDALRCALVNELLTTQLSSDRDDPGAGYGLQRALAAVRVLNGFISLRTDRVWLCGHFAHGDADGPPDGLTTVETACGLGEIVGTQVNILLPMRID